MNKIILAGRLTSDPELREIGKGKDSYNVANFSIAVDRDKETTDFFRCSAVGRTADTIAEYLHKGDQIIIDGSVVTSKYQPEWADKEVTTYDIRISRFDFGAKSSNSSESKATRSERRRSR